MSLPKALLCVLKDDSGVSGEPQEEVSLRQAGFATATLYWSELGTEVNAWTQLSDLLADESVLSGAPEDFTAAVLSEVTLTTLSLRRAKLPATALVIETDGPLTERSRPELSPLMDHIKIYHHNDPFAGRMMAARFRTASKLPRPFHLQAHLSSLVGVWLEAGPPEGEQWPGFMVAVTGAAVDFLGLGPRGQLPCDCRLNYPMLGLKGELAGEEFIGCAAKNILGPETAAYVCLNGLPDRLLVGSYPDAEAADMESWAQVLALA